MIFFRQEKTTTATPFEKRSALHHPIVHANKTEDEAWSAKAAVIDASLPPLLSENCEAAGCIHSPLSDKADTATYTAQILLHALSYRRLFSLSALFAGMEGGGGGAKNRKAMWLVTS